MSTPQPPDCWLILVTPRDGDPQWWHHATCCDRQTARRVAQFERRLHGHINKYKPVRMVPAEVAE